MSNKKIIFNAYNHSSKKVKSDGAIDLDLEEVLDLECIEYVDKLSVEEVEQIAQEVIDFLKCYQLGCIHPGKGLKATCGFWTERGRTDKTIKIYSTKNDIFRCIPIETNDSEKYRMVWAEGNTAKQVHLEFHREYTNSTTSFMIDIKGASPKRKYGGK